MFFGVIRALSLYAPIAHINCVGIIFDYMQMCYTKQLLPSYLCNHFGPHSRGRRKPQKMQILQKTPYFTEN